MQNAWRANLRSHLAGQRHPYSYTLISSAGKRQDVFSKVVSTRLGGTLCNETTPAGAWSGSFPVPFCGVPHVFAARR
jgi:hypothetical protein